MSGCFRTPLLGNIVYAAVRSFRVVSNAAEINGWNVRDVLEARTEGKRSYRRSRGILADANGHGVPRTDQTEGCGLQSLVLSIGILRGPVSDSDRQCRLPGSGRHRPSVPGVIPRANAAGVDKRLECGADLPLGEQGAVKGTLLEIASSNNRSDPAGFVVDGHQGSLDVAATLASGQVGLEREASGLRISFG